MDGGLPMQLLRVAEEGDGIVRLTLDRADKRNALSTALHDQISDALDALASRDDLKVVIVRGAGEVFCAGFDLGEFQVDDAEFQQRLWASSDRYHQSVLRFPLPTVAAVNGPALAGGFDLAMMCDLRIAASTARFAHPEHSWGDVMYAPLEMHVGGAIARELVFTGRDVEADEALRLGLVSRVVPPADLDAVVLEVAQEIAAAPADVLRRTKAKIVARAAIGGDAATLAM